MVFEVLLTRRASHKRLHNWSKADNFYLRAAHVTNSGVDVDRLTNGGSTHKGSNKRKLKSLLRRTCRNQKQKTEALFGNMSEDHSQADTRGERIQIKVLGNGHRKEDELCSSFYYCPTVGALENERILLEQWTYFTYCSSIKLSNGIALLALLSYLFCVVPSLCPTKLRKVTRFMRTNWMGYVAFLNNETTACLGQRDIILAWHGTVTNLEWMEDLMDFLKPVSAQKLANKDPHIKVDKDQSCEYSKFSAREQMIRSNVV
ncbi:hypothetical protein Tco_0321577 [Tanacetum coccineum]